MTSHTCPTRPARALRALAPFAVALGLIAVPTPATAAQSERYSTALSAVRAPQAWSKAQGQGVLVAVIDSGVDPRNANLRGQVLPGVDLFKPSRPNGWTDPIPFGGHGTGVASVIAGTGRGNGVWGVAPKAKILPVRVTNDVGFSPDQRIARAVRWSVTRGADVINISMGGYKNNAELRSAITFALRNKVVVVAPSGNDGAEETRPFYPAAYPGVIAVGGWNTATHGVVGFANRGRWVDVVAPATHVLNTCTDGTAGIAAGTSWASPAVAGAAALLLSMNHHLTPARIEYLLESTAVDVDEPGRDTNSGHGLLDIRAAVAAATHHSAEGARP